MPGKYEFDIYVQSLNYLGLDYEEKLIIDVKPITEEA